MTHSGAGTPLCRCSVPQHVRSAPRVTVAVTTLTITHAIARSRGRRIIVDRASPTSRRRRSSPRSPAWPRRTTVHRRAPFAQPRAGRGRRVRRSATAPGVRILAVGQVVDRDERRQALDEALRERVLGAEPPRVGVLGVECRMPSRSLHESRPPAARAGLRPRFRARRFRRSGCASRRSRVR
jgi:hypothetical protein